MACATASGDMGNKRGKMQSKSEDDYKDTWLNARKKRRKMEKNYDSGYFRGDGGNSTIEY